MHKLIAGGILALLLGVGVAYAYSPDTFKGIGQMINLSSTSASDQSSKVTTALQNLVSETASGSNAKVVFTTPSQTIQVSAPNIVTEPSGQVILTAGNVSTTTTSTISQADFQSWLNVYMNNIAQGQTPFRIGSAGFSKIATIIGQANSGQLDYASAEAQIKAIGG